MHRLRTSVLLRGSADVLIAALLIAAEAAFLWMFFSADAVERLAGADRVMLRFASDWRHGTAANTWLYMPGFFATAAAAWLAAPLIRRRPILFSIGPAIAAACLAAAAARTVGVPLILTDFERATAHALPAAMAPPLSAGGALRGLYTLAAWTVFVLACRRALVERTWRPFLAPAILALGLALIRPWTLGDVGGEWAARAGAGDPIACASAVAIVAVAGLLASSVQCSQRRT